MPTQTRGSTGGANRKPVRRDPEKRRQQNIQAQKKYREKLRKRLESLEALAASAAQIRAVEEPPPAVEMDPSGPAVTLVQDSPMIALPHIATKNIPASGAAGPFPGAVVPAGLSAGLCQPVNTFSATFPSWEPSSCLDDFSTSPTTFDSTMYASSSNDLSLSSLWATSLAVPLSDDISSVPSSWDSTASDSQRPVNPPSALSTVGPKFQGIPSFLVPETHNKRSDGAHCTSIIKCGCPRPHIRVQTRGPYPFRSGEIRFLSLGTGAPTADPYTNHIRIDTLCTVTALYDLGLHIGVNESMLCADESFSPFYRPSAGSADSLANASMIGTVQKIFKALKPDLRPSREQITIPHHPSIDILPFPTLRKNLLMHHDELDEDELFDDLITGLVCWGGAGMGRRDRHDSIGCHPTGTPWDVRSWEAKVWFLKKYWTLLGGEDGELVRQSEWWRGIRGEEVEVYGSEEWKTPDDSPLV
ncbi:bZIP transcription factor [Aspergillus saccharolyticus JOP 1030-1]|uniref:BZIP domain-containing protein n=1 Tax=Aspergillus saccharolyticus JOP 1030-1 TaxID=1450539 RepID=A0A318ZED1_9EURO|nr:hypothetical protein BP01DRAFT_356097 [Aspergillus saccharolyticus JOP 1030-1]PYH45891.1 hypothetical protein BP01DRAFT_356097 [Aspergillus saccharolyticus JOP 1030-1]